MVSLHEARRSNCGVISCNTPRKMLELNILTSDNIMTHSRRRDWRAIRLFLLQTHLLDDRSPARDFFIDISRRGGRIHIGYDLKARSGETIF